MKTKIALLLTAFTLLATTGFTDDTTYDSYEEVEEIVEILDGVECIKTPTLKCPRGGFLYIDQHKCYHCGKIEARMPCYKAPQRCTMYKHPVQDKKGCYHCKKNKKRRS